MSRIYLSGPMSGLPEYNYPAFKEAAELLRGDKKDVISPTDRLNHEPPEVTATYHLGLLKDSIKDLLECDEMLLLPGWNESRGVALEILLAALFQYDIRRMIIKRDVGGYYLFPVKFTLHDAAAHFIRVWIIPLT